jgi:glycerate-2-kinase
LHEVARALVDESFRDAVRALDPRALVEESVRAAAMRAPVTLLAIGKAAARMAEGAAAALGDALAGGVVVTKDGHAAGARLPGSIEVRAAAHPVPDARSVAAGERLLEVAAGAPAQGTLLVLVSGGASALACAPSAGVPLADKLEAVRALAAAGAPIDELNALRKHLSRVKGGRLAAAARARVVCLALSDVIGDDASVVGGGPAAPDPSTFALALAVCARHGVLARLPVSVRQHLERGAKGGAGAPTETVKSLPGARVSVLAGPDALAAAAATALGARGATVEQVHTRVAGPVEALGAQLAANAVALAWRLGPGETRAIVFGGEPTVTLPASPGRGGRAQHTALLAAARMRDMPWPPGTQVAVLCAGSDGSDGPTGDAGGVVDPASCARARAAGVDPARAVGAFDSGTALAAAGDLVTTGPTGTNLCDLFLVGAARR